MAKQELGELYWKITGDSSSFDKNVGNSEKKMTKFGKGVVGAGVAIAGALVAAGAGAFKLAKDAGEAADKLLDLEQVTGLSTDTLQEMKFIAAEAGVGFDGLVGAAQKFTAKIPDLESGSSNAAKAFAGLGVDLRDASGELRSQDELFPELISSLQGVENITERNAIAQQLFGRSLGDLAPVLGMTQEQFAALRLEANDVGAVLSKTALESANSFRASLDTLAVQSESTKTAIGATLAPIFESVLVPALESVNTKLTEVANSFTTFTQSAEGIEKISKIAGTVTGSFAAIGAVATPILDSLKTALGNITEPFVTLSEETEGTGIGFQIFGAASVAVTGALNILGTAIGAGINNFINLYQAATSTADLVGAAWDKLWGNITKEEYQAQLALTGTAFTELGVEIVEGLGDTFTVIGDTILNFTKDTAASADDIAAAYEESYDKTAQIVAGTLQEIADKENENADDIIQTEEELAAERLAIWETEQAEFLRLQEEKKEKYKETMGTISNLTSEVGGYISSIWGSVNDYQTNLANAEIQQIEDKLAATEEGTEQQAKLEKELSDKKKKLAYEQAKREKSQAIFSAVIDTSVAVVKMLADPGGVIGVVLSALALAAGIAEVASISARPLPSFEQGGIVPDLSGIPSSGDAQTIRVNGGETIIPQDENRNLNITMMMDSEVIARSTIEDYANKGRVLIDLTRAAM